jgi:thioredoxin 1
LILSQNTPNNFAGIIIIIISKAPGGNQEDKKKKPRRPIEFPCFFSLARQPSKPKPVIMDSDAAVRHVSSADDFSSLLSSTTYVVVDFSAEWCGPCKQIAPIYAQLAKTHGIDGHLAFAKVDVDHVQAVAQQYRVTAMPTFLFFKNGKQVAVNGNALIRGADVRSLSAAADKMGRLAKEKAAATTTQVKD